MEGKGEERREEKVKEMGGEEGDGGGTEEKRKEEEVRTKTVHNFSVDKPCDLLPLTKTQILSSYAPRF